MKGYFLVSEETNYAKLDQTQTIGSWCRRRWKWCTYT